MLAAIASHPAVQPLLLTWQYPPEAVEDGHLGAVDVKLNEFTSLGLDQVGRPVAVVGEAQHAHLEGACREGRHKDVIRAPENLDGT